MATSAQANSHHLARPEFAVCGERAGIAAQTQALARRPRSACAYRWGVPGGSADGEDRLGRRNLELREDLGELGADGRGLNDGPALARVADGLEPPQGAGEPAPGK